MPMSTFCCLFYTSGLFTFSLFSHSHPYPHPEAGGNQLFSCLANLMSTKTCQEFPAGQQQGAWLLRAGLRSQPTCLLTSSAPEPLTHDSSRCSDFTDLCPLSVSKANQDTMELCQAMWRTARTQRTRRKTSRELATVLLAHPPNHTTQLQVTQLGRYNAQLCELSALTASKTNTPSLPTGKTLGSQLSNTIVKISLGQFILSPEITRQLAHPGAQILNVSQELRYISKAFIALDCSL